MAKSKSYMPVYRAKRGELSESRDELVVNGSASFSVPDSRLQAYHAERIQELEKDTYDDGTYNLSTLQTVEYTSGYQVTFCQIGDNYSADEYADKVKEFIGASSDGITSAGKFGGTPEVSFNVSSKEEAIKLAKKYNQMSIWDWSADPAVAAIDTGGTGKREL